MYPMHPDDRDYAYSTDAEIDRAFARSGCDPDPAKCVCRGSGWIGSERDAHYTCLRHFADQPHPESYDPYDYMTPAEIEAELEADRLAAVNCKECGDSGWVYAEGSDGLLHSLVCACRAEEEGYVFF